MTKWNFSRRSFLGLLVAAPFGLRARAASAILIGLELYSVRQSLQKDPMGTTQAVAKIGYQCVEFYAPYYDWTPDYARQVRTQLDDLGVRCHSTHNDSKAFTAEGIGKALELNHLLGARYIVLAHPGEVNGLD